MGIVFNPPELKRVKNEISDKEALKDLDRSHGCPSTIQDLDRSRGHTPTFFATNSGVVPQSRVWLFLQRGNAIRFSRYVRAFHKYRHVDHGMVE